MAEINLTAIAATSISTPAAGVEAVYIDLTTKRLASKNDAGVVSDYADLTSTQTLAGKTLTTPNIGAATGTSLVATGIITSSGITGIGYATGAGGTVTQATSKVTAFTLSKVTGTITFAADALAADTSTAGAVWTNTAIAATDMVIFTHVSGGTLGGYNIACLPAAGSATIYLRNITPGSLSEAPVFRFTVIKSVNA
jgi:hypothetical protein